MTDSASAFASVVAECEALRARNVQLLDALREMMIVYAGIGHGAGWEIAPENRELLIRAAEQARAVVLSERRADAERLREEFDELAAEWHAATDHLSVLWQQAIHPAYQAIIGMGDAAVPHILRHMKWGLDPSWIWALRAIARNRDAPGGAGVTRAYCPTDRDEAIAAWERWAQERGLL